MCCFYSMRMKRKVQFQAFQDSYEKYVDRQTAKRAQKILREIPRGGKKIKIIVFDLGGTLMEYQGMPLNWSEYYEKGFRRIAEQFSVAVTAEQLDQSSAVMRSWNPSIRPREEEEDPRLIFEQALAGWDCPIPVEKAIETFFDGLELRAEIYPDVPPALRQLRAAGWTIAALTDLPTAMPDELFKRHIQKLLPYFDCYVSSQSCGFRRQIRQGCTGSPKNIMSPTCELVFVGDEDKDELTARNAGCYFISISRSSYKEHRS